MCTALSYKHFFGRNLDYEFSFGEEIAIAPRGFDFNFRYAEPKNSNNYAIAGMAHVDKGYPLYYDAFNEKGLAVAGLNFVGNASFSSFKDGDVNVCAFELIPWILCQCKNVDEARSLLESTNVIAEAINEKFPVAELHFMLSDGSNTIVVEFMKDKLHIYDNDTGVLTNNPPFDKQRFYLNNFASLSRKNPENTFSSDIDFYAYSRGMGSLGLPGDLSSSSRFVKIAFTRANSVSGDTIGDLSQFFHILHSVEQQNGLCEVSEGKFEHTIYSSACDLENKIYYYTTYNDHRIKGVDLKKHLEGRDLKTYPMLDSEDINMQN